MTDASAPAANGWPDPEEPGVPLNPERDGWHWLMVMGEEPFWWQSSPQLWCLHGDWLTPAQIADAFVRSPRPYRGPCLTPDQIATLTAERDARAAPAANGLRSGHHDERLAIRVRQGDGLTGGERECAYFLMLMAAREIPALTAERDTLHQVMLDTARALGCEPDNEKMLEAIEGIRAEERERCAKVCDKIAISAGQFRAYEESGAAACCARDIRALANPATASPSEGSDA